jgi:hypothetical protein
MTDKEGILANPAPLGLLGFGVTTVLLNIHNTLLAATVFQRPPTHGLAKAETELPLAPEQTTT